MTLFLSILRTAPTERGHGLILVLVLLMAVGLSSTSFIWYMNRAQTYAGHRYRSAAALQAAEAGLQSALAILESRPRRSQANYAGRLTTGAGDTEYRLSIEPAAGGTHNVLSEGRTGGVVRRIRARVHLASPALLAALYASTVIRFDDQATAIVVGPERPGWRPWSHLAAGKEISFATSEVSINDPSVSFKMPRGPGDPHGGVEDTAAPSTLEPLRMLLSTETQLTLGKLPHPVTIEQLRVANRQLAGLAHRTDGLPPVPDVDRALLRSLAAVNRSNTHVNRAAGRFSADPDLEEKADSVYTPGQFSSVLRYGGSTKGIRSLAGVIFVTGGVTLEGGTTLRIADGALVVEDFVHLREDALLHVEHTVRTRHLPGVIVLDAGGITVRPGAQLRVHGLVYSNLVVLIEPGGYAEIVGGLVSNDPAVGLIARGTLLVRYDPAVLGTAGVVVSAEDPVIGWIAATEEIP